MENNKFKPFWVVEVNNWLCDASYNGKELKAKHPFPTFRKFHFIRSWNELDQFTIRDQITNRDLVDHCLATTSKPEQP